MTVGQWLLNKFAHFEGGSWRVLRNIALAIGLAACAVTEHEQSEKWIELPTPSASIDHGFTWPHSIIEKDESVVLLSERRFGEVWRADFRTGLMTAAGSKGDGPGEFRSVHEMLAWRGDSIAVITHGAALRISILSPDGNSARTIQLSDVYGRTPSGDGFEALPNFSRRDDSARLYGTSSEILPTGGGRSRVADSVAIMRFDSSYVSFDTVAFLRIDEGTGFHQVAAEATRWQVGRGPYASVNDWAVMSDGTIVLVAARTYAISFVRRGAPTRTANVTGDTRYRVSSARWQRHIDSAGRVLQDLMRATRQLVGPQAGSPGSVNPMPYDVPSMPEFWPPVMTSISRIKVAGSHIWIPVAGPDTPSKQYWHVVDTSGTIRARYALPERTQLLEVTPRYVYTARIDADDLRWVGRSPNPTF